MNNNKVIPDYRCFFCATRVFGELMEKLNIPAKDKSIFTREMAMQYSKTWDCYFSPEFSRSLHLMVKKYTGVNDPYKNEKRESNDFILSFQIMINLNIRRDADRCRYVKMHTYLDN